MGLPSYDTQEVRRQAVLNILKDNGPHTLDEIADRMTSNYYTIRKSMLELEELGLAYRTGQVKDRKEIWSAGQSGGIPEFFDPTGNRKIPVDEVALAAESGTPASVKAASAFFEIVQQLVQLSIELANGTANVTPGQLQALRHQMIVNKSYLKNLVGFYEQTLQNPSFWSLDELGVIGLKINEKRRSQ